VTYRVTRIDITQDGHLYVEVDFGTCINDFVFVNVPTHPDHDVDEMVLSAISAFEADIPALGHSGDMRDPSFILGGLDPRGHRLKLAHLVAM